MKFPEGDIQKKRSRIQNGYLIQNYHESKYDLNFFLFLTILIWIPIHVGSSFLLAELETTFDVKESAQFIMLQSLTIGYHSHLTTESAMYFATIVTCILLPFSVFIAIIYTIWWNNHIQKILPPISQLKRIFVVWILTIGLTFAVLPSNSLSNNLYIIQNFATTIGFLIEGDLKYYSLIIFAHASWIYCGTLYLILEMLISTMGTFTNATSRSIRKTIGGMYRADNIIAQLVRLSPEEFEEVKARVEVISQSNSRASHSRRSSGKIHVRHSRMSSIILPNMKQKETTERTETAEDEN